MVLYPVGVFLMFGLMGGFSNNMTADGYFGYFLFNWAGFVAPTYSFYNFSSVILPILNHIPCADYTSHEGFAYLGAGIILPSFILGFGFCFALFFKKYRENIKIFINNYKCLCFLFCFLFIFFVLLSSLPKICFADKVFSPELPAFIKFFYSILRAAGRYIWTDVFIIYFLVLSAVLRLLRPQIATMIIFTMLLLQIIDLKDLLYNIHTDYALKKTFVSFVKTEYIWNKIAEGKRNCFISDDGRYHTEKIYPIYFWGLKRGLRFNAMVYSRQEKSENSVFAERLTNPKDDDLFIFLPFHQGYNLSGVNCYYVDGCSICTKKPSDVSENYHTKNNIP